MKLFRLRENGAASGGRTFRVTGNNTPATQRCNLEEGNFLLAIDMVEAMGRGPIVYAPEARSADRSPDVEALLRSWD